MTQPTPVVALAVSRMNDVLNSPGLRFASLHRVRPYLHPTKSIRFASDLRANKNVSYVTPGVPIVCYSRQKTKLTLRER